MKGNLIFAALYIAAAVCLLVLIAGFCGDSFLYGFAGAGGLWVVKKVFNYCLQKDLLPLWVVPQYNRIMQE